MKNPISIYFQDRRKYRSYDPYIGQHRRTCGSCDPSIYRKFENPKCLGKLKVFKRPKNMFRTSKTSTIVFSFFKIYRISWFFPLFYPPRGALLYKFPHFYAPLVIVHCLRFCCADSQCGCCLGRQSAPCCLH